MRVRMSDLRQFRHFVALAEHGHYARAAEAVNLSQPALSRSIQALEGQLGCTLVERGSRGVALTAHGRLVLEHARRLLAGHRALHNAVSQLGNLDSGELRLGGGPFPAARLLPEALAGFSSAHPRVRVALLIEDWQTLRQRLLDDAVELFVADIRELQGDPQLRIHRYASIPAYSSAAPAIRCWVWSGRAPGNWPITRWPARVCPRKSAATWRACCNATNRSAYSATMC